ncbi:MAG: vitamin K epoxide reductase [Chloroflexi bacterium]|nr:vitamin K epoxide reductase [Chloroflexota bacterium]
MSEPSAWPHRVAVVVLALLGAAIATYLTLYQWQVTSSVWDPIFGPGSSEAVLTSPISRMLPLPDATLGAIAYLVEALLAGLGGTDRWRRQRGLVLVYGIALAGLALTSVGLVLVQLLVVHAFCTLCLSSAALSWVNAWLGHGEVIAALKPFTELHLEESGCKLQISDQKS